MPSDFVVTFKDEDEVNGVPVGPVLIWDRVLLEVSKASGAIGIPFGETPDELILDMGWKTKPEAIAIAKSYDTELEES